jgi:nitrile hydratase
MIEHDHQQGHGSDDPSHPHNAPLPDVQLRVRAPESLLVEKGLVDPAVLDELVAVRDKGGTT